MSEEKKIDLRIVKTHAQLWEAMVSLTVEQGYATTTVNDICRRAMVNRSTFYRHFEDKDDLLLRKTDEILFEMARKAKNPREVAAEQDYSEYEAFLGFIAEHGTFFKIMLGPGGNHAFTDRVYSYLHDVTWMRLREWPLDFENPPVPLELILHYISGAHLSLIRWWVENDLPCGIPELVKHNVLLFTTDPLSLLGMSDEVMRAIRAV